MEEYLINPKICKECSLPHSFEKRNSTYCSASCGATAGNRNRLPRTAESKLKTANTLADRGYKKKYNCLTCNELLPKKGKFCKKKECRFEQRSKNAKLSIQHAKDNGNFKGWAKRTKNPSYPEQYFIDVFNNESITDYVREFKVDKWYIDFAFINKKIALEIDGRQHDEITRQQSDKLKDLCLEREGWKVIRIKWFNPINENNKNLLYPQIEKFKKIINE